MFQFYLSAVTSPGLWNTLHSDRSMARKTSRRFWSVVSVKNAAQHWSVAHSVVSLSFVNSTHTCTHTHTHTHTHMCTHTHVYTHTCIHTHSHSYIHVYTHTLFSLLLKVYTVKPMLILVSSILKKNHVFVLESIYLLLFIHGMFLLSFFSP